MTVQITFVHKGKRKNVYKKKKKSQLSYTELEKPYFALYMKALWSTMQTQLEQSKTQIVAMIPLTKRVDLQYAIQ